MLMMMMGMTMTSTRGAEAIPKSVYLRVSARERETRRETTKRRKVPEKRGKTFILCRLSIERRGIDSLKFAFEINGRQRQEGEQRRSRP